MPYKIGVDGGGTKTECILVDSSGAIVARHVAPGCNPSVVGPAEAKRIVGDALRTLVHSAPGDRPATVTHTHIYSAGSRAFWRETAAALQEFGEVFTADDSYPVLELATHGRPGLVLHGGTGSFVAARGTDGRVHYAGGVGWRFGDPGSGYDLGRRAVARALLELQGWAPASRLGPAVRDHTGLGEIADVGMVTRHFYTHADPNRQIAALAPTVLQLAADGELAANQIIAESIGELLALATRVAAKLFPDAPLEQLPAGLSGPILTNPVVMTALAGRSVLALKPVEGAPIEGVRRLLMRG